MDGTEKNNYATCCRFHEFLTLSAFSAGLNLSSSKKVGQTRPKNNSSKERRFLSLTYDIFLQNASAECLKELCATLILLELQWTALQVNGPCFRLGHSFDQALLARIKVQSVAYPALAH